MTSVPYSIHNLPFYRERAHLCLELAEKSQSALAVKLRLEALAREYQQRVIELERHLKESPPLVPKDEDAAPSYSAEAELPDQFDAADELPS
jgi:hypothetical protein